jgi:glycosyltransferase involved in cell wall biosynthesis
MRVVFCTHSRTPSGATRCLELLIEANQDKDIESVFTVRGLGPNTAWLERNGVPFEIAEVVWWVSEERTTSWQGRKFYCGLRDRVERLKEIFKSWKPDLVVTNTSVILEPALAAAEMGIRHVWHVLEVIGRDPDLQPMLNPSLYGRIISALSDRVIAVSKIVATELTLNQVPSEQISVINTGIDLSQRDRIVPIDRKSVGFAQEDIIFIYVGLLSERKGVAVFARAVVDLGHRIPRARFLFVGRDGGIQRSVERTLADQERAGRVRFLGHRNDALSLMLASDVVVMPSIVDPLPVTVLEAMSLSKPVLATRSGGCEEMVVHGETGLLVPPNDSHALANSILEMSSDSDRRLRWGENGKTRVQANFNVQEYHSRFISELRNVPSVKDPDGRRFIADLVMAQESIVSAPVRTILGQESYDVAKKWFHAGGLSKALTQIRKR